MKIQELLDKFPNTIDATAEILPNRFYVFQLKQHSLYAVIDSLLESLKAANINALIIVGGDVGLFELSCDAAVLGGGGDEK